MSCLQVFCSRQTEVFDKDVRIIKEMIRGGARFLQPFYCGKAVVKSMTTIYRKRKHCADYEGVAHLDHW